jgi:hypothetical protein
MILILILVFIIVAIGVFIALPTLLDLLVDTYDEWVHILNRIERRRKK